jgi:hypothetical protein
MKIICDHCYEPFTPTRSQRADINCGAPYRLFLCSDACKRAVQEKREKEAAAEAAARPAPPPPEPTVWMYDLHIRAPDTCAFRRFLRTLGDDVALVRVQRSEQRKQPRYALQMVIRPVRPGQPRSIAEHIAALGRMPLVPEDLINTSTGSRGEPSDAGGNPDEAAEK